MFAFQSKEKMGSSSEELSSETSSKNCPFVGGVSNSQLIQLLSGSASDAPESPNASSSQNTSGIPAGLKAKYEQRSGVSMDDVSVHYNSDKPIQYGALAYTQGNDVYLGPGQEKHLGHELGHVIQQKQGRVPVTGSVGGAPLNDDPALEQEADSLLSGDSPVQHITAGYHSDSGAPIQRLRINLAGDSKDSYSPEVQYMVHFSIPTAGDKRLLISSEEPDKIKQSVLQCKEELGRNEDIVFEGHGACPHNGSDTINLQGFSPKELAKMAAAIPKPDDWQGKIILFACSGGHFASEVAQEYYDQTRTSVTVVGADEDIRFITHPSDTSQVFFGVVNPQKEWATNSSKPDYRFLFNCVYQIKKFYNQIKYLLDDVSQSPQTYAQDSSEKCSELFASLSNDLSLFSQTFLQEHPELGPNLKNLSDKVKAAHQQAQNLYISLLSPDLSSQQAASLRSSLLSSLQQLKSLSANIYYECAKLYYPAIDMPLDFGGKQSMISVTHTLEELRKCHKKKLKANLLRFPNVLTTCYSCVDILYRISNIVGSPSSLREKINSLNIIVEQELDKSLEEIKKMQDTAPKKFWKTHPTLSRHLSSFVKPIYDIKRNVSDLCWRRISGATNDELNSELQKLPDLISRACNEYKNLLWADQEEATPFELPEEMDLFEVKEEDNISSDASKKPSDSFEAANATEEWSDSVRLENSFEEWSDSFDTANAPEEWSGSVRLENSFEE